MCVKEMQFLFQPIQTFFFFLLFTINIFMIFDGVHVKYWISLQVKLHSGGEWLIRKQTPKAL